MTVKIKFLSAKMSRNLLAELQGRNDNIGASTNPFETNPFAVGYVDVENPPATINENQTNDGKSYLFNLPCAPHFCKKIIWEKNFLPLGNVLRNFSHTHFNPIFEV